MSILANPDGDLENADEESEKLIENMDQLNDDKNEFIINASSYGHSSLKDTLSLIRNSDFFHFAGHAVYHSENYRKSGWLLGDDFLTAGDINKMFASSMPVLVFSNACQSARTEEWMPKNSNKEFSGLLNDLKQFKSIDQVLKNERSASPERFVENQSFEIETFDLDENFGLVNAFLRSGVKFYIGTNWKILDEPGSRFAIYFYTNFLRGLSIGESIKKARLSCIEKYGPDSIDWASYVLYGDPRFSLKYMHTKKEYETSDVVKERRVDAIAPEYAEINNQIDLIVQVCLFGSPALSYDDIPIKHKPHSVAQGSETIELEFPVKPDGQLESVCIKIKVISTHFTVKNDNEKQLKIPPDKDSKRVIFYLIAKQVGNCRINIEFSSYDKTYLGSIPIEIQVSDQPSLDIVPLTLNSFSFMYKMADKNVKFIGSYLYERVPESFRFNKKKSNEQNILCCPSDMQSNKEILYRGGQNWLFNEVKNINLKWVTGLTSLMILFLIFFSIIEIMLHPPQSFDVNHICNNEEISHELLDDMRAFTTDSLINNNFVACDTNISVTGTSRDVYPKIVDSGHYAIRRVITKHSIKAFEGADQPENFEIVFNNNSVGAGAKALGISKFVATSNDTSLSSSKPATTAYICQVVAHGGHQPYKYTMPSNILNELSLSSNDDIHGTPEISKAEFIDIKPINYPVGAGAKSLGITPFVFVAIAEDASAASWNPAGLLQIHQVEYKHMCDMSAPFDLSNTTWNTVGKSLGIEYNHTDIQGINNEFKLEYNAIDLYSNRPLSLNAQYRSNLENILKSISQNIQQYETTSDFNIKSKFNHKWKYNFTKNRWEFHSTVGLKF
jgi:hypothetical protein